MTSATSTNADSYDDVEYVTSLTAQELDTISKWMARAFESGKLIALFKLALGLICFPMQTHSVPYGSLKPLVSIE